MIGGDRGAVDKYFDDYNTQGLEKAIFEVISKQGANNVKVPNCSNKLFSLSIIKNKMFAQSNEIVPGKWFVSSDRQRVEDAFGCVLL